MLPDKELDTLQLKFKKAVKIRDKLEKELKMKNQIIHDTKIKIGNDRKQIKKFQEQINKKAEIIQKNQQYIKEVQITQKKVQERYQKVLEGIQILENKINAIENQKTKNPSIFTDTFVEEMEADLHQVRLQREQIQSNIGSIPDNVTNQQDDREQHAQTSEAFNSQFNKKNQVTSFDPGLDDLSLFEDNELTQKSETTRDTPNKIQKSSKQENETTEHEEDLLQTVKKTLCIICHGNILLNEVEKYSRCPNDHRVHDDCLKQWMIHSKNCPVCHEPYHSQILSKFEDYLKTIEEERKKIQEQEEQKKMEDNTQKLEINQEYQHKLQQGRKFFKKNNFDKALIYFWDILDNKYYSPSDPHSTKIIFQIGLTYFKLKKYSLALRQFNKVVQNDYRYPLGFYFLGQTYEAMGLPGKALWAYERSFKNLKQQVEKKTSLNPFLNIVEDKLKKKSEK